MARRNGLERRGAPLKASVRPFGRQFRLTSMGAFTRGCARGSARGMIRPGMLYWVPLVVAGYYWFQDPTLLASSDQQQILLVLFTLLGLVLAGSSVRLRIREGGEPQLAPNGFGSNGFHQKLFENAPGPIVLSDAQDRILAVNDAYSRMTGYTPVSYTHLRCRR